MGNDYDKCRDCKHIDMFHSFDEPCVRCKDNDHFVKRYEWGMSEKTEFTENIRVVDHINPDHYKSETSLECIEAMEIIFGEMPVYNFCICNAWKYIWRWKNKNGVEDLHKADWYIHRARRYCKGGEPTTLKGISNYIIREINNWEATHEKS